MQIRYKDRFIFNETDCYWIERTDTAPNVFQFKARFRDGFERSFVVDNESDLITIFNQIVDRPLTEDEKKLGDAVNDAVENPSEWGDADEKERFCPRLELVDGDYPHENL